MFPTATLENGVKGLPPQRGASWNNHLNIGRKLSRKAFIVLQLVVHTKSDRTNSVNNDETIANRYTKWV